MKTPTIEELREIAQQFPEKIPYLKMLVLFGSRATGKTHAKSDWDFAALYDEEKRNIYTIEQFSTKSNTKLGEQGKAPQGFYHFCLWHVRSEFAVNNDWGLFEVPLILGKVFVIDHENIDVVELNNCSWLVAHFIARDGILLYEKDPGGFEYFRLTSLRPESEMKKFRQEQRQLIEMELKKWKVEI